MPLYFWLFGPHDGLINTLRFMIQKGPSYLAFDRFLPLDASTAADSV